MKRSVALLFYITLSLPLVVCGQDIFPPPTLPKAIKATQVHEALKIDGKLDETVWHQAHMITDFIQVEPQQGEPSKNKTIVKVLFNERNLYVGVWCFDSLGRSAIRASDMKRDFNWRTHDTFAICIDGFNDRRNSASFVTNPYGVQKDYLSFDDILFDSDWNGLWKVRTTMTGEGWFSEFEIPWKTLRYAAAGDDESVWGINFLRLRRATNEISVWSPYPRSFGFNRMGYAGQLENIDPPAPSTNIQVNPYSLASFSKNGNESTDNTFKIGGDVKWVINSNTVADFTINNDFAQADADVQVNNVTRFSVLFPERRQFFLENASLFGPGLLASENVGGSMQILPFFSRRIGLGANGTPLPITGGVRMVNRSLKQNIGVMGIRQNQLDSLSGSNSFVGRYSRNFGTQNRIGLVTTVKTNDESHTNVVGGVDAFVRVDQSSALSFMGLASSNTNKTGRGVGGYVHYLYVTNTITAWLTESLITKTFDPELGFLSRSNVIGSTSGFTANLRGRYLPFKKNIRSFQPGVTANWFHVASTRALTEREIKVSPFKLEMQNGGYVEFYTSFIRQNLLAPFDPLGMTIDTGVYNYNRHAVSAGTDQSRKMSFTFLHEFGRYFNGHLNTTTGSVSVIPLPHIALTAGVTINNVRDVGLQEETKNISLYTIQGRLALNPRVQLTGIYQMNSQNDVNSYNIRFSWEYKPLSYLYLVLNNRTVPSTSDAGGNNEMQGTVKLSYLKQF